MALNKIANVAKYAVLNTIIHLLFHYFYCIDPYFIFKLTILICLVFCCSTASYSVTCDCSIRVTVVLEYLKSAKGCAAS